MKTYLKFFGLTLVMLIALHSSVLAERLYTTDLPFFSDGLDLMTGDTVRDPSILIVVFGPDDEIEQVVKPALANLADFNEHPEIDLYLEYDPTAENPFLLMPEYLLEIAVLEEYSPDLLDRVDPQTLSFASVNPGEGIRFNADDLLFFKTDATEYLFAMQIGHSGGIEIPQISVGRVAAIPEPSLLALMTLGLLVLAGLTRRQRKTA